jgi:urease accessory protein
MARRTARSDHLVAADPGPPVLALLSLLQLTDSAFPNGRFTLSYGLESLAQGGLLETPSCPSTLEAVLTDQICLGVAPSDGVALACAHRSIGPGGEIDWSGLVAADSRLTAVKLAREARDASTRTGQAVLDTASAWLSGTVLVEYARRVREGTSPGNHAVVLGILTAELGVPCTDAIAGELFGFAASWVAAAVRLSLTDHRTGQALLYRACEVSAQAAVKATTGRIDEISSCVPHLDAVAMCHEEAELRLFAS